MSYKNYLRHSLVGDLIRGLGRGWSSVTVEPLRSFKRVSTERSRVRLTNVQPFCW